MTGSEFFEKIKFMKWQEREQEVLNAFIRGDVPGWISSAPWHPVHITGTVDGTKHDLIIQVAPDYWSVGTSEDFLRMPARPTTYQQIAAAIGAILPSRKLVNEIWAAADAKVEPSPITGGGDVADSHLYADINNKINSQLKALGRSPANSLVAGDKKDVVIGPNMDGSKVAIYGWHRLTDKQPWQSYPGPHDVAHVDYSHGGRMVARTALLNAVPVDLAAVFVHPTLHVLVSDQGPFLPFFPNVGSGVKSFATVNELPKDVLPEAALKGAVEGWGVKEWLLAMTVVGVGAWTFMKKD